VILEIQVMKCSTCSYDVSDRILLPKFMEVEFFQGTPWIFDSALARILKTETASEMTSSGRDRELIRR